jgi:regulation of enolase protein 1 (concanavalin A-like superfamily)
MAVPSIRGFGHGSLDSRLAWHNEPVRWSLESGVLVVEPEPNTDFWCRPQKGVEADTGHFLFAPVSGSFRVSARITIAPRNQYDQAGLMVRISRSCWLKASIEYEDESFSRLGAVVTNGGYSDWSTQDVSSSMTRYHLRASRDQGDYVIEASFDGQAWTQLRMAHLFEDIDPAAAVSCGVYACSPTASGFAERFEEFVINGQP